MHEYESGVECPANILQCEAKRCILILSTRPHPKYCISIHCELVNGDLLLCVGSITYMMVMDSQNDGCKL